MNAITVHCTINLNLCATNFFKFIYYFSTGSGAARQQTKGVQLTFFKFIYYFSTGSGAACRKTKGELHKLFLDIFFCFRSSHHHALASFQTERGNAMVNMFSADCIAVSTLVV